MGSDGMLCVTQGTRKSGSTNSANSQTTTPATTLLLLQTVNNSNMATAIPVNVVSSRETGLNTGNKILNSNMKYAADGNTASLKTKPIAIAPKTTSDTKQIGHTTKVFNTMSTGTQSVLKSSTIMSNAIKAVDSACDKIQQQRVRRDTARISCEYCPYWCDTPRTVSIALTDTPRIVSIALIDTPRIVSIALIDTVDWCDIARIVSIALIDNARIVSIALIDTPRIVSIALIDTPRIVSIALIDNARIVSIALIDTVDWCDIARIVSIALIDNARI
ncbi:predicted protein, partial [Nematostella vectensis]